MNTDDVFSWLALGPEYRVCRFEAGRERSCKEINWQRVHTFLVLVNEQPVLILFPREWERLRFFWRVFLRAGGTSFRVMVVVGKKETKTCFYVLPSGLVLCSHDSELGLVDRIGLEATQDAGLADCIGCTAR